MRLPRLALCAAGVTAAACDAAGPVPEFDDTPMVAVLITAGPPPRPGSAAPDSGLFAALLTTGTPVRSPYLRADRFQMRRVSDGALFAWRPITPPREALPVLSQVVGNYFLPRIDGAGGLGSDSLTPGGVYELAVEAGRHRIVGRTRIPGPVEFVRAPTDGDTIVRWRRTPGAAAYAFGGDFLFLGDRPLHRDTALVVYRLAPVPGEEPPPAVRVRVFAVDSNYAAFHGDLRVSRGGVSGGWGVFGSFTWAETELPPPQAARATRP